MKYKHYKKEQINILSAMVNIITLIFTVIITVASALIIYCNVSLELYPVSQNSMYPTINPNRVDEDFVYVTKNVSHINHGDVIVYKHNGKLVVKRVIAMQGDKLKIDTTEDDTFAFFIQKAGQNTWQQVNENYIQDKSVYQQQYYDFYSPHYNKTFETDSNGDRYLIVENGEIFCLGDNRLESNDSIDYGCQPVENIIGEVEYIVHGQDFRITQIFLQFLGLVTWK